MNKKTFADQFSEQEQEQLVENLKQPFDISKHINGNVRTPHPTLIFKPQKTWVMKINIKKQKTKSSVIKLLVVAEDYQTAKEVAEDFVNKYTEKNVYISNINGSLLEYEYLVKHKTENENE